jgi:hypothetical protein
MSPVASLILCCIAFVAGLFIGESDKVDLVVQLAEKDAEIDALNDEADDLSRRLFRAVSPLDVPKEGRVA